LTQGAIALTRAATALTQGAIALTQGAIALTRAATAFPPPGLCVDPLRGHGSFWCGYRAGRAPLLREGRPVGLASGPSQVPFAGLWAKGCFG